MSRLLDRRTLGLPGLIGFGLWAACLALYFALLQPAQQHLDELQRQMATYQAAATPARQNARALPESNATRLADFYQVFPGRQSLPDLIGQIAGIAGSHGLGLNQGEYQSLPDPLGKLDRVQMVVPLKGSYPQIRACIEDIYRALPVVALEQVQFERQKVGDTQLDARLRLLLFVGGAS